MIALLNLYYCIVLLYCITCITESKSSLIDTIFTNWRLVCSGVWHIAISDHSLTYIYIIIVNYPRSLLSNGVRLNKNCKLYNRNREKFRIDIFRLYWSCANDDLNVLSADCHGLSFSF